MKKLLFSLFVAGAASANGQSFQDFDKNFDPIVVKAGQTVELTAGFSLDKQPSKPLPFDLADKFLEITSVSQINGKTYEKENCPMGKVSSENTTVYFYAHYLGVKDEKKELIGIVAVSYSNQKKVFEDILLYKMQVGKKAINVILNEKNQLFISTDYQGGIQLYQVEKDGKVSKHL